MKHFTLALMLVACGDDNGSSGGDVTAQTTQQQDVASELGPDTPLDQYPLNGLYTDITNFIVVEIAYADGAEPYTGSVGIGGGDLWDIFKNNVTALFTKHPKSLQVPTTLAEMTAIGDAGTGPYTTDEILALADAHRQVHDDHGRRTFFMLYLDGVWEDDNGPRNDVLAVSIGNTGVIAVFKPVIAGTGLSKERVEQTTLVHEFGHAVGLVNNGVPTVAAHQDTEHGGHCQNSKCIMYWRNEVGADLSSYVADNLLGGSSTVLFDDDCLDDAAAASGP